MSAPLLHIAALREQPEHIDQVIDWHFAEWGHHHPGQTREDRRRDILATELGEPGDIPCMFLGTLDGVPVGTAALIECDLSHRRDLRPWLASVYVAVEHRGAGHGSALVRRVMDYAASLDESPVYLFTPDAVPFYERLGWIRQEPEDWNGTAVEVMRWPRA